MMVLESSAKAFKKIKIERDDQLSQMLLTS